MITRLMMGALVLAVSACATPVEAPAPGAECRDIVRSAAMHAYALARFRDDQRAVILLPAGKAAAEYEAETKRLRDEGGRLMTKLEAAYPDAAALPPLPAVVPGSVTDAQVAARIAAADACLANGGK